MTRVSKKIIAWLLGAVAVFAIAFGIVIARPQVKTAKAAETAVTFNAAALRDASHETYGTSIRFDTIGETWKTYHNWVAASDWASIADYTTVNGRTVTEINNATSSKQKITLMMQPAGSFSFLRLYIPAEIMSISDVKSMGILDGWSFNNGTNNYTTSAVTFLRNGDTMVPSASFSAVTKLSASDITIGDAELTNPIDVNRGADSYYVNIDIGKNIAGQYETMYDQYKTIRNAIYINGKSIEEWNTQKLAEDSRFGNPWMYSCFPQNSTDPDHLAPFVKPVCLWATDTGFKLSIFQELVADCETVTVTVGAGCTAAGKFMVAESKSKTVLTQSVVDLTKKLTFLDNTSGGGPAWKDDTNQYYIHTNNETCWTKDAPKGGCLNECDPAAAGGGQVQLKYIYFNGTSVYDINKTDDGTYNSEHNNIKTGGAYAPVFAIMSTELGSTLKLVAPMEFDGGRRESIVIKKGFNLVENGVSYYVKHDVIFTNTGSGWTKTVKAEEIATEVTGIKTYANRTDGGTNENFVIFQLSNNDYEGLNTTAIVDMRSLFGYIDIDGNVLSATPSEPFFNVWGIQNSIAFRAPGLDAAGLQQVKYITIKAGAKFPAYTTQNGGDLTYYVTQEDVTFVHNVPNDTWTIGEYTGEETIGTSVKSIVTSDGYIGIELTQSDYTNADSEYTADLSSLVGFIDFGGTIMGSKPAESTAWYSPASDSTWPSSVVFIAPGFSTGYTGLDYITIKAGAKFPAYENVASGANRYYVTEADITFYKHSNGTWQTTMEKQVVDVTSEIAFAHQSQQYGGTETYLIKTANNYWTKNPKGGCLNEHDPNGAGGGQDQLKYIYFNGKSLYDINKEDNGSYGSAQANIAGGGIYAPILATMGSDSGKYSYIQIHVPTAYPNEGATANVNHSSIEIKSGFTVEENGVTYTITKDIKWVNINGSWVNEDLAFDAGNITIGNPHMGGIANELYQVEITSNKFNITCNQYDFMYSHPYSEYRKSIFINGVSVYDINENTDDSGYVYSSFPMVGADDAIFAKPIIIEKVDANTLSIWIHKTYMETLGEDVVVTLGAGYNAFTGGAVLSENVNYSMTALVTINDGTNVREEIVIKGTVLSLGAPSKEMTETMEYVFDNWYIADTDTVYNMSDPVVEDISIVAKFITSSFILHETEIAEIYYSVTGENKADRWLLFYLSENDYPTDVRLYDINGHYDVLVKLGLFEHIKLQGEFTIGGATKTEATLQEIFNANGHGEAIYLNIWEQEQYLNTFSVRVPGAVKITSITIEEGAFFPSYRYLSGASVKEIRYAVMRTTTYQHKNVAEGLNGYLVNDPKAEYGISMEDGAAVRITSDLNTSGIRFQTNISKAGIAELRSKLEDGTYASVTFGTLIVPTSYLMGGQFTHAWLAANGLEPLDIVSTAGFYRDGNSITEVWPKETADSVSFFGSIVKLKEANYSRYFSGIGYIMIETSEGEVIYIYASYNSANSRSAAFVAQAAISDRSANKVDEYQYKIDENNNYSPYTESENGFLKNYITWSDSVITAEGFELAKGASAVVTTESTTLAGPYVELLYSTNINVWGVFTYTDGNKTVDEDFYLQAGTSQHKQFLDLFRSNGVGYGMNQKTLSMVKITLKNAELENRTGTVKVLALSSQNRTVETENQELYVTKAQKDGTEMTVGAHLGLGGSLTYLAKSGIYEGVKGGSSAWDKGTVAISKNASDFSETNIYKNGTSTGTEPGYYGNATSSKASDGAVNLINNFDAGRQIQQSWYANIGGSSEATAGQNGYTRAYCYTGSTAGQYWPYNPVQAGDVVSNPGQIIDYEHTADYIYIKARAMDWAKGYDPNKPCANAVEGGVTTKSYVENYYRLSNDGTLVVNNAFVDWNGFTDMESAGWASTELPAVYPVHTLNYYVSNIDGDGSWTDGLEYNNKLSSWVSNAYHQFADGSQGDTKVEDWFAWANDANGSVALGMYIPNVNRWTSGRSLTTTSYKTDVNFQNANALPVKNYTEWSWDSFSNVDKVSDLAERGNILKDKQMMSNMQAIKYTYQSAYVSNTSYTAPGIEFRMQAYVPIEYSYVLCVNDVNTIRSTFKSIKDKGTITNAGAPGSYEKVGLDAWARADKKWTW